MIHEGMTVRTNYGTGPYIVTEIVSGCTCPSFTDIINMAAPPASRKHFHLKCHKEGAKGNFLLNGYDENLNSVWGNDRLIDCEEETLFLTMCCGF